MAQSVNIGLSFLGCHRRGGVERTVFEYARYLASRDHNVTVFANEWEVDKTQPSIRYIYVPLREHPASLKVVSYLPNCTKLLSGVSLDVFNTHGCVCPFDGIHRVQSVHRDWLNQSRLHRKFFSVPAIKQRLNPMHPAILRLEAQHFRERRYRKVVVLTEHVRDVLNRYYGVPFEDVEIVPNGFAPEEFNPNMRAARRVGMRAHLALRDSDIVLLFVAHELQRKGYATILQAMRILKRKDIKLLVVGKADTATARRMAAAAGLQDQVLLCGPTNDVAGYHAASDIFVLPTQYEAFCLAILEALGSGVPVVTSAVPGARDAIVPGINGAIIQNSDDGVELAAALSPLLEQAFRERVSEQAPATVAAYQWPATMSRYEQILLQNR